MKSKKCDMRSVQPVTIDALNRYYLKWYLENKRTHPNMVLMTLEQYLRFEGMLFNYGKTATQLTFRGVPVELHKS